MSNLTDMFGEVISSYTREQALEDGFIVQVDEGLRKEAGFHWPVFLTAEANERITPPASSHTDYTGTMWDVLTMMRYYIKMQDRSSSDPIRFVVLIRRRRVWFTCEIAPNDDDGSPALLVKLEK